MIASRISTLLKRRRAAAALGVKFKRSASFVLPHSIHFGGSEHRLNLPDENGVKVAFIDLLLDDCYGCRRLQLSGAPVSTILDIGGNVGLFGLAARAVFPAARIHCYEPNSMLEPYLKVQAATAKLDLFFEAVGLEEGKISLDLNEDSVQTRSRRDSSGTIPQISFRQAIDRFGGEVDFVKMDCEGAEWEIFSDRASWQKVRHVAMEYHLFRPDQSAERVRAILQDLGFRITSFQPIGSFGLLTATRHP